MLNPLISVSVVSVSPSPCSKSGLIQLQFAESEHACRFAFDSSQETTHQISIGLYHLQKEAHKGMHSPFLSFTSEKHRTEGCPDMLLLC